MPWKDIILDLPGFRIKKVTGTSPLQLEVVFTKKAECIHCGSKRLRKKASYKRCVRHESIGHRQTLLNFKAYKFHCSHCKRYFNQQFPGIGKYQRATERLKKQIFHQHTEGISQKSLARDFKVGKATIERWYHHCYVRESGKLQQAKCPTVLGIDEHFFSKKQGFATTLCNLKRHRIFDVVKGRSISELSSYFDELPGKEQVKVVCMDLSSSYRALVERYFPQAKIVADRFHVIRLLLQQCMQTYQLIDPKLRYKRGLLSILRMNAENLTEKRIKKRDEYLLQHPAIKVVYEFKEQLHRLLMKKTVTQKKCKRLIPVFLSMVNQLKQSAFKPLASLGKTLNSWKEEIVCMWRFTKNNGITEGFHRKMKLIQRRAYGFRNFENYRLRVKVLCC